MEVNQTSSSMLKFPETTNQRFYRTLFLIRLQEQCIMEYHKKFMQAHRHGLSLPFQNQLSKHFHTHPLKHFKVLNLYKWNPYHVNAQVLELSAWHKIWLVFQGISLHLTSVEKAIHPLNKLKFTHKVHHKI